MSAFLGPIHYWLYHKIQFQEEFILTILKTAEQEGWNAISSGLLDSVCGKAESRPLEEVIDQGNIHGWLQQKIGVCETRLAFLAAGLLEEDASRLDALKAAAYSFGKKHPVQTGIGADEVFRYLEDTLLNGMPCDRVNMVLEQGADRTAWKQTQCVHKNYWEQVGGDVSVYDTLRIQIITGMLKNSSFRFQALENGEFEIRKG